MSNAWASILRDSTLSPVSRLILMHKLDQAGDETVESLGTALHLGRDRITRGLGDLMVAGLAQRVVVTEPGSPPRAKWRFSQGGEFPTTGCPNCGPSQVRETPTTGNHDLGPTSEFDGDATREVSRVPAPGFGINTQLPATNAPEEDLDQNQEKVSLGEGGAGGEPGSGPAKRVRRTYSADFEMVWASYGRRGAKPAAWAQWQKAITREEPDVIIAAMVAYIDATAKDPKFRKHLERWLRDDCWESDIPVTQTKAEQDFEKRKDMGSHQRHEDRRKYNLARWTNETFKKKTGHNDEAIAQMRKEWDIPEPKEDQPK